jgi:pyruvate,water dikinase
MGRIRDFILRTLRAPEPPLAPEAVEGLRLAFKDRYHHFKLLLSANNRALERMAEIEEALRGCQPFGMTFVRSACTDASVNVLRMIRSMEQLAPGRYRELRPRYESINAALQAALTPLRREPSATRGPLVIGLADLGGSQVELAGSKMAQLGEIRNRLQLVVPDGFVITTAAYERFFETAGIQDEINRLFQSTAPDDLTALMSLSARVQQLVLRAPLPEDLRGAIDSAWQDLAARRGPHLTVAVRSSSLFEDRAGSSFAGQFRTELNVSRDYLLEAYREVVASKYSLHAISYRLSRGFRDEDVAVAVGCVAMVEAVAGGVAYSANPVDPADRRIHISATWGLPKAIVDGTGAHDRFVVTRGSPLAVSEARIGHKDTRFVCYPDEGVCRLAQTGAAADRPSLSDDQIVTLAATVLQLEAHYGGPLDVEWAVAPEGALVVLQCRPLQQRESAGAVREAAAPLEGFPLLVEGGVAASTGAASGTVYLARKSADALQFPSGAILVVRQALPQWAALINRAAGVVSEQGGVAGHLASVAREFGVPALFGCAGAMEALPPGETVTLDADQGRVYRGKAEALLDRGAACPNRMAGSPVYDVLQEASRCIVPLKLLDPGAAEFHPANCRTLHDLTRFMHEKSVHEMFNFGREHHFPERSSKQLFFKVPMQWWVLNLDDGFAEEVTDRYVRLENITSVPMRAFWEGFVAIPWDGPPPLDHRGFAAVLFQSTAQTALTPGRRSAFAEKNYFMISRNYCNLSSRLGYHFATLEALVSERRPENYISFQFKGGAADDQRRLKRVQFIAAILEQRDFRVDLHEDNLIARIEHQDCATMQQRLKVLGYLSLHTRQLDMIMTNPAQVAYFRGKIEADLDRITALPVAPCA